MRLVAVTVGVIDAIYATYEQAEPTFSPLSILFRDTYHPVRDERDLAFEGSKL